MSKHVQDKNGQQRKNVDKKIAHEKMSRKKNIMTPPPPEKQRQQAAPGGKIYAVPYPLSL